MSVVIKSAVVSTAPGLVQLRRDPALVGDNGGVKFLFDVGFTYCWPGGVPASGSVIKDVGDTANGDFELVGGQTMAIAGGGFDFSGLTAEPANIRAPAGALSSIWSGNQYFMVVGYEKLPTSGDWNTLPGLHCHACATDTQTGYTSGEADLVIIAQSSNPRFDARRQTNGATVATLNITALTNFYGQVCQWAYWRTATETGLRLRSALGSVVTTGPSGAANVTDFSGKRFKWGVPETLNTLSGSTPMQNASNRRLYRGWIEDLQVSGRNPVTVLDADWTFFTGLGRYS